MSALSPPSPAEPPGRTRSPIPALGIPTRHSPSCCSEPSRDLELCSLYPGTPQSCPPLVPALPPITIPSGFHPGSGRARRKMPPPPPSPPPPPPPHPSLASSSGKPLAAVGAPACDRWGDLEPSLQHHRALQPSARPGSCCSQAVLKTNVIPCVTEKSWGASSSEFSGVGLWGPSFGAVLLL